MALDKYIKLSYPEKISKMSYLHLSTIHLKDFVDLNLEIRSNSQIFLKLLQRTYCMFFISAVKKYYAKEFSPKTNVCIEVIFDNEKEEYFSKAFSDLEMHIKYLLWGRFIILHASCVRYNNFNLFFMGDIGSGKSTICSAIFEQRGIVLSEDCSLLEVGTEKAYLFPTLKGNIRGGVKTDFQQEYLMHLRKYEGSPLVRNMISMKQREFQLLLRYHKNLYRINENLAGGNSDKYINAFILLEKENQNGGRFLIRKKAIDILPRLMQNVAANHKYYKQLMKESLELFLKSRCYILNRAPLELMVAAICSRFK